MDSPGHQRYLRTVQPEYRNLGFASEVVRLFWDYPGKDVLGVDVVEDRDKVKRTLRFLRRLGLIDDGELTDSGIWLATIFEAPKQRSLDGSSPGIGYKGELNKHEREAYLSLLTGNHWLPMLATVHHISHDKVPEQMSERPVNLFAERINHLGPYNDLSHNAWRTRASVHYGWFQQLGLSAKRGDRLVLTDDGVDYERTVREHYPSDWEQFE